MAWGGGEFLPVKYILSVIVNHISHTGVPHIPAQAAGLTYALHAALCLPGCVGGPAVGYGLENGKHRGCVRWYDCGGE
jgi:hypothetical protein